MFLYIMYKIVARDDTGKKDTNHDKNDLDNLIYVNPRGVENIFRFL